MSEPNRNLPDTGRTVMPSLGGEQGLNRYLTEIKKFPVLTAEQEYMLAKRYAELLDLPCVTNVFKLDITGTTGRAERALELGRRGRERHRALPGGDEGRRQRPRGAGGELNGCGQRHFRRGRVLLSGAALFLVGRTLL